MTIPSLLSLFCFFFFQLTLAVESSVLCDCGSEVVQLSQKENLLLMSTLAKPVLLDMTTGQTTQVINPQYLLEGIV